MTRIHTVEQLALLEAMGTAMHRMATGWHGRVVERLHQDQVRSESGRCGVEAGHEPYMLCPLPPLYFATAVLPSALEHASRCPNYRANPPRQSINALCHC